MGQSARSLESSRGLSGQVASEQRFGVSHHGGLWNESFGQRELVQRPWRGGKRHRAPPDLVGMKGASFQAKWVP